MYLISVVLLLLIFPVASIIFEALWRGSFAELTPLVGKWFVFWPIGVRLFIAGLRQVARPSFTAEHIFQIKDAAVLPIVREIGFGNLAMGKSRVAHASEPNVPPAGRHSWRALLWPSRLGPCVSWAPDPAGWTALVSDLLIFFVLVAVILAMAAPFEF